MRDIHELEARLTAMEVLILSMVRIMDAAEFKESYAIEKEAAIAGLLGNSTVSDKMHDMLEKRLSEYEQLFGMRPG